MRRRSIKINIGKVAIGEDSPIAIESMTNTDTKDSAATIEQILSLEMAGCEIVRLAIYDKECAEAIGTIKRNINIPLIADIHFDYRLAIASIENGIDNVRINPGNIGKINGVISLVSAATEHNVPIRIGVNSGSIKKDHLIKYGNTALGLVESALEHISILESRNFYNIVVSAKSSDVSKTVEANRILADRINYPLHLGVTEAGTTQVGAIKSAIGIGSLLLDGIGDTIRVSLTASPIEEIKVANLILRSVGAKKTGIEIISCPTCARCGIDLIDLVNKLQERLPTVEGYLKVAVMGCAVNGPGEAKDADIGIAAGKDKAVFFKKGEIVKVMKPSDILDELENEIRKLVGHAG